tara:strand:+ start:233 stop:652 length:420 start_codon:yes stop_codon:yes gene_type:complete
VVVLAVQTTTKVEVAVLDLIVDLAFSRYQSLVQLKRSRLVEVVKVHRVTAMVLSELIQHLATLLPAMAAEVVTMMTVKPQRAARHLAEVIWTALVFLQPLTFFLAGTEHNREGMDKVLAPEAMLYLAVLVVEDVMLREM